MARALKVYSWIGYRTVAAETGRTCQTDEMVAASSIAEVLRLTGMTRAEWKHFGGVTGNEHMIKVAMSAPGVVFWTELDTAGRTDANWRRADV